MSCGTSTKREFFFVDASERLKAAFLHLRYQVKCDKFVSYQLVYHKLVCHKLAGSQSTSAGDRFRDGRRNE